MKHATAAALSHIGPLLAELRALPGLREKQPGIFYRGSRAWLHFHEDGERLFADLKQGRAWHRLPVGSAQQAAALTQQVRDSLSAG